MRRLNSISAVMSFFLLSVCSVAAQTNIITTAAGGGNQNNIPGTLANLSFPAGIAVDGNNNVYFSAQILCQVFKLDSSGQLFVVAGTGICGFRGYGGPASSARIDGPSGVAVDSSGNLFFADANNSRVVRVDATTKILSTVAGNGVSGFGGDGGPATSAELANPAGVAVDSSGNVFIGDGGNARIRRVDAQTRIITTVAGTGTPGFNGDGVAATLADLNSPYGVAVDSAGNLFIADTNNHRIRRVDATTQTISTVVGTGVAGLSGDAGLATSAQLNFPRGVMVNGSGDLYISDTDNARVRLVDHVTQTITTVAGSSYLGFTGDGGPATSANLYFPLGVALDSYGDLFIVDSFNFRIRRVDANTKNITTVAGGGSGGDGALASGVQLIEPQGVAVDNSGNIFIADSYSQRIRRVDASSQIITTTVGTGVMGLAGDGGPGSSARLSYPAGVAADSSGNLFIADTLNASIRRWDASLQIVSTVAGTGPFGFSGDGGAATGAKLNTPTAVAVDGSGNLFIADQSNHRIRRVDATTQIITTVAGTGTAGFNNDGVLATLAQLSSPSGVAVDTYGNLFIADMNNNRVRRVDATTQIITTVAGIGGPTCGDDEGVLATLAQICSPSGVALDSSGNLYFSEPILAGVRRVDVATQIVNSVAGSGNSGFSGDGGPALSAQLNIPMGIATDSSGHLYIADEMNNRIRVTLLPPFIVVQPGTLSFSSQNLATTSAAQPVTLTNTGLVPLNVASISVTPGFTETDDCAAAINPLATCTIHVSFSPATPGAQSGTLTITDNAFASPHAIGASGTGVGPVASLSAPSLTFSNQLAGTTSGAQPLTLNNTGNASLTITNIAASGNFAATDNCNGSVAAYGSCTISITFTPMAGGTRHGTLTVTDDSGGVADTLQTAILAGTGTGAAVALSGSSLGFGSQLIRTRSVAQTVTLTNRGTTNLTISTASIGGTNAGDFSKSTDSCTGAALTPNSTCTVSVAFIPTATGSRGASLSFADNALDSPQAVTLAGTGTAPAVSLSGASLTFADQLAGTTSAAQTVTITNTGTANLAISTATLGGANAGDFAKGTDNCTGATVTPNSTCAVGVTFTPSAMGSRVGSLSFTDNAGGSPHTVALTGTGLAPGVSLSGASLTFANQLVGSTSAVRTVTVTNSGTANLTISTATLGGTNAGDFAKSADACTGATVTPNNACTVSVTFTPSSTGSRSGSLSFTDNAGGSPHTVALTGTGLAPGVSLSGASLTFANQLVSSTSAAQTVTVTNSGTANLTISTATLGGTNAGDFAKSADTCTGATVTPTGTCTVSVTFTPSSTGSRSGSLSFTDNASGSPHTVGLTGTGIAPAVSLSSSSVTFADQLVSTASASQTVTVTNSGTANLTISTATLGGTNAGDFAKSTDTCAGATVAPNHTCTIAVAFTPAAVGSRSGTLTLADNAAGSPHVLALAGTGQDFSIGMASGSPSTASVPQGQAATYSLSMSGFGSLNQTVNFTCTGAPAEATCTVNPSSVPSGTSGTVAVTVTVHTTAASLVPPVVRNAPPFRFGGKAWFGAFGLLGLSLLVSLAVGFAGMKQQRKVFRYGLSIAALTALALAMAACGGGGGGGGGGFHDSGTPAGTYTLTVVGSSAGLQHSTTLTLTVN